MASPQDISLALSKALDEMHSAFVERNPVSRQLFQSSLRNLPGANTRTVLHADPYPLVFDSAEGAMLTSVDGHAYTDFLNDYSAGLLGHSDPAIQQVLRDTISKGLSFGGQNRHEKDLAAKIVQRFGEAGIELVRFTNSGTEANTMAIASATLVTGRSKILVFTGGNHGGTMAFPRTNGQANVQPAKIMTANLPHEWVLAPFNNVEESEKIINGLPPKSLAAILVETLQGAGGCRPATREFLAFLRRVADSRGSILIVDEVMTSRLGYAGHIASMGLTADIVTMGKYMGGGMSFGVFGGRRDIMQIFDPLSGGVKHAGTFNNNVLSMAAGVAALDIFSKSRLDELNKLGADFKRSLQSVLIHHGHYPEGMDPSDDVIEVDSLEGDAGVQVMTEPKTKRIGRLPMIFVTGFGSLIGVRFSGRDSAVWSALLYHFMLKNNVYLAPRGYMALSLETTREHMALFVSLFGSFLTEFGPLMRED